ncbi:RNA-directed DNA polymerase, eukaryota [Tanacetum coccineum]
MLDNMSPLADIFPSRYMRWSPKKGIRLAIISLMHRLLLLFVDTPVGGMEEEQPSPSVDLLWSIILNPLPMIDGHGFLIFWFPIKVNILAWKVCLDKLPTRLNLSLRGIDIPSIICPNCGLAGESCSHLILLLYI